MKVIALWSAVGPKRRRGALGDEALRVKGREGIGFRDTSCDASRYASFTI